jgi:hypothetical protein
MDVDVAVQLAFPLFRPSPILANALPVPVYASRAGITRQGASQSASLPVCRVYARREGLSNRMLVVHLRRWRELKIPIVRCSLLRILVERNLPVLVLSRDVGSLSQPILLVETEYL